MSEPPNTVLHATPDEEAAIRAAVRAAGTQRHLASVDDAEAVCALFSDPGLSDWLYDLPRPFTPQNVRAWIAEKVERNQRGESILSISKNEGGEVVSYSDVTIWPDRSSAELAGGGRSDRQNSGRGSANARGSFDYIFEILGVRLMCLTAALDNVRSQKMIDNAGFRRMGERDCLRPDGSVRRSVYWELTRDEWREKWGQGKAG
jgi:RimJ/RimL family protein N-acetyltransferase